MSYITTNADRLAMIDVLRISSSISITGQNTDNSTTRTWTVIAMVDEDEGCIAEGNTIEEAVDAWFIQADLDRPHSVTIYQAKADAST